MKSHSNRQIAGYIDTDLGKLAITQATSDDVDAAYAIMVDVARWLVERGIYQPEWIFSDAGLEHIQRVITGWKLYLAWLGDEAIASLWVCWEDPMSWGERGNDGRAGYVHGFGVKRCYAGNHVGSALLEWTAKMIAVKGRRLIRLDCDANNPAICAYYDRLGFTDHGAAIISNSRHRLYERECLR